MLWLWWLLMEYNNDRVLRKNVDTLLMKYNGGKILGGNFDMIIKE